MIKLYKNNNYKLDIKKDKYHHNIRTLFPDIKLAESIFTENLNGDNIYKTTEYTLSIIISKKKDINILQNNFKYKEQRILDMINNNKTYEVYTVIEKYEQIIAIFKKLIDCRNINNIILSFKFENKFYLIFKKLKYKNVQGYEIKSYFEGAIKVLKWINKNNIYLKKDMNLKNLYYGNIYVTYSLINMIDDITLNYHEQCNKLTLDLKKQNKTKNIIEFNELKNNIKKSNNYNLVYSFYKMKFKNRYQNISIDLNKAYNLIN